MNIYLQTKDNEWLPRGWRNDATTAVGYWGFWSSSVDVCHVVRLIIQTRKVKPRQGISFLSRASCQDKADPKTVEGGDNDVLQQMLCLTGMVWLARMCTKLCVTGMLGLAWTCTMLCVRGMLGLAPTCTECSDVALSVTGLWITDLLPVAPASIRALFFQPITHHEQSILYIYIYI